MKRKDVIRHLESNGCEFLREGANHTVYVNRIKKKVSIVSRRREIDEAYHRNPIILDELN